MIEEEISQLVARVEELMLVDLMQFQKMILTMTGESHCENIHESRINTDLKIKVYE